MQLHYAIPPEAAQHLGLGKWVEIFEAYGRTDDTGTLQVISMRIAGKILNFSEGRHKKSTIKPHEGEVVSIDRDASATRFKIRLRS